MKFALFAQAEGVRSSSADTFWATESGSGVVTDASLSARKRGIQPGMPIRTAKALVPDLTHAEEVDGLPESLEKILQIVLQFTPWIEVVEKDAFYFQIPGNRPPLQEIRRILDRIHQQLTEEQRILVGLAETPKLARALIEWNRFERVPDALYWRVGRQLWLVAPSLAGVVSGEPVVDSDSDAWVEEMPIPAFWGAPKNVKDRLMSLGVHRMSELAKVPVSYLKRQFGPESLSWTQFTESATGQLRVNYPLQRFIRKWVPNLGEEVPGERLFEIVQDLAQDLANDLRQRGLGALKVGVAWTSDVTRNKTRSEVRSEVRNEVRNAPNETRSQESYERATRQPVYQRDQLLAALLPGCTSCQVRELTSVEVYAEDIQPLTSVQMALSEQRPEDRRGTVDVLRLIRHVNRKFPDALRVGMRPTFRELRLQAVLEGGVAGWSQTSRI